MLFKIYPMKIIKITLVLVITLTLSFCGNDKKSNNNTDLEVIEIDTKPEKEVYPEPALNAKFKNEKIGNAYNAYSKLQNALVNTNAKDAAVSAETLILALQEAGAYDVAVQAAKQVLETQDIAYQRAQFVVITAAMENLLADALDAGMIYKMYCPMAFNNNGGYWLSSDKQVQNPYFGDKMYRCGRVDDTIQ